MSYYESFKYVNDQHSNQRGLYIIYSQIFLGVVMILISLLSWTNSDFIISKKVKQDVAEHKVKLFQKASVFPFFLLGIIFIAMGIIEEKNILETSIFIIVYVALSIMPLSILIRNKKKYLR